MVILQRWAFTRVLSSAVNADLAWPHKAHVNPYDILNVSGGKGSAVSQPDIKSKYYQLVKMYHPDVNQGQQDRFRKIVLAYDILSDPARKYAYDTYGAGWDSAPGLSQQGYQRWDPGRHRGNEKPRHVWNEFYAGNASATSTSAPTTNVNLIAIISFLAFLGVLMQAVRIAKVTDRFQKGSEDRHVRSSRDLVVARRNALIGRDDRLDYFMIGRKHNNYMLMIKDDDVCGIDTLT